MVEIFQYCSGSDLVTLAESYQDETVWSVVSNQRLWRLAVIGPGDMKKSVKYLGAHTSSLTLIGVTNKINKSGSKQSVLSESLMSSIRLKCSQLRELIIRNCILDTHVIRFSLFPRHVQYLRLDNVSLQNLPQMRQAVRSSPFYCIKRSLPQLEKLELNNPFYLQSFDSHAIIAGCRTVPGPVIDGEDHIYTFRNENSEEEDERILTRVGRRDTKKLFQDLIDFHFTKRNYNTRRVQPS